MKWSYCIVTLGVSHSPLEDERLLMQAGSDGWELVNIVVYNTSRDGNKTFAYFKRPRERNPESLNQPVNPGWTR